MNVTSYHMMNGLFMQPGNPVLDSFLLYFNLSVTGGKQKNHFLCLHSNHRVFPAWMMIPLIFHVVSGDTKMCL